MTIEELYNHIETLYNNFDFKSKLIIDNLIIIGKDNYYQLFLSLSDNHKLQLRISKQYSIIKNTSGRRCVDYILNYEIIDSNESQNYNEIKDKVPEQVIKLLLPTIREFKLKILSEETK